MNNVEFSNKKNVISISSIDNYNFFDIIALRTEQSFLEKLCSHKSYCPQSIYQGLRKTQKMCLLYIVWLQRVPNTETPSNT